LWSFTCTVAFPFQKYVPFTVELTEERRHLPESMERNVPWLMQNLGEIWNAVASVLNKACEAECIQTPAKFALEDVHARIPDRVLEAAEWRLRIQIANMHGSFEVVFKGLQVVKHACGER
jgi:hypothetical protein